MLIVMYLSVSILSNCDCTNSSFRHPHHKHVITGDLRIIKNNKLREQRVYTKENTKDRAEVFL